MNGIKPKVLLIDDDQMLIDMYKHKFLVDGQCRLSTTTDTTQAISLAETEQPQLILLDLVLPKQSGIPDAINKEVGFNLLSALKNNPQTKNIPVVVFTNLDEGIKNENLERAQKLGAVDFWVKARYQPSEVVDKVKKLVKI
ncbi:MAG: response regulator [Patescibacteria group bacterium]